MKETCAQCRWWRRLKAPEWSDDTPTAGQCRAPDSKMWSGEENTYDDHPGVAVHTNENFGCNQFVEVDPPKVHSVVIEDSIKFEDKR